MLDVLCNDGDSVVELVDFNMEIKKLYEKMVHTLQPREAQVIEMRYGLNGHEEKTQREIACILDISRSYVSRIEKKALKKLDLELNRE